MYKYTNFRVKAKKTQTYPSSNTVSISLPFSHHSHFPISTTMEIQTLSQKPNIDYRSNVDTSTPFRSVKEAVAVFGERFLTPEIYSPKPTFSFPKQENSWNYFPPSPQKSKDGDREPKLADTLKKLESELEETKVELKLLKERESETEVALASLNAELHKNMSKIAQAEAAAAAAAGKAVAVLGRNGVREEESRRRGMIVRMENSPTLAQILSVGEKEGLFGGRKKERKMMKKKPIIPLVIDLFSRKKGSSTTLHNPLYSSSHVHWN